MNLICLAIPLLAASPLLQSFQDSDVEGLRFHRVHLNNGNFIDGQLMKETPSSILLKIRLGEMTIRRDSIARVEFIKMRDRNQKLDDILKGKQDASKDPGGKGEEQINRDTVNVETPEALKKRVDLILYRFKNTPGGGDDRAIPFEEIAQLGEEATVYLASRVPAFDLKTQDAIGVALIRLNELKRSDKANAVLEGYLKHEAAAVRAVSVNVLSNGSTESERIRLFQPMLGDKDRSVRITVMSAIGSVEDRQWFETLSSLSADADADIRGRALRILRTLAEKHDLKDLFQRLMISNFNASDAGAQSDAIAMVALLGQKESWKDVAPMLGSPEAEVRATAAKALANLGVPEADEDLASAASGERDASVRKALTVGIQKFRVKKATETMIQWLRESDEGVQDAAESTLRVLSGENFGRDADKWQEWWDKKK